MKAITLISLFCVSIYGYSQSLKLDAGYGDKGISYISSCFSSTDNTIPRALLSTSDSQLLVCGYKGKTNSNDGFIVKFKNDGSFDEGFGVNGSLVIPDSKNVLLYDIALQSDGKILVAGGIGNSTLISFIVYRILSHGQIDSTFGFNGSAIITFPSAVSAYVNAISVLSDDKILLSGPLALSGISVSVNPPASFTIVRLNKNGDLDYTFNSTGKVSYNFANSSSNDIPQDMIVQADGKFIVVGSSKVSTSDVDFAMLRCNANGSLDYSFGNSGRAIKDVTGSSDDYLYGVNLQSDGKILVCGTSQGDYAMARYLSDGNIDLTFNTTGLVLNSWPSTNDIAYRVFENNNRIYLTGTGNSKFSVLVYDNDGRPDSTYGTNALVSVPFVTNDIAYTATIGNDNKLIMAGVTAGLEGQDAVVAICRFSPNKSTLDNSFNSTGKIISGLCMSAELYAMDICRDKNGEIIMGGRSTSDVERHVIAKLDKKGFPIASFGYSGFAARAKVNQISRISIHSDERIISAGYTIPGTSLTKDFAVFAHLSNGRIDSSFGVKGLKVYNVGSGADDYVTGLVLQDNGKIIVGGYTEGGVMGADFALLRLNADGSTDNSFGSNGLVLTNLGGNDYCSAIALQSEGRVIAAGYSGKNLVLVRYSADGILDTQFGLSGILKIQLEDTTAFVVHNMQVLPDNSIYVTGMISGTIEKGDMFLFKSLANGAADYSFGNNGFVRVNGGAKDYAKEVIYTIDNRFLLIGTSQKAPQPYAESIIACVNSNGVINYDFGNLGIVRISQGVNTSLETSTAMMKDNELLIAGWSNANGTFCMYSTLLFYSPDFCLPPPTVDPDPGTDPGVDPVTGLDNQQNMALMFYPNPCYIEQSATLFYHIPDNGPVDISIFDINGKKIATVLHSAGSNDKHVIEFIPSKYGLKQGTFFVKYSTQTKDDTFTIMIR